MRTIDVLLNNVANFLAVNVVLLEKHVFLFIRCDIKYMVNTSRKKYAFTLAETVWLHDVSHFLFAVVGLVLQIMISEVHILVRKNPSFGKKVVFGWKCLIHSHQISGKVIFSRYTLNARVHIHFLVRQQF